MARRRSSLRLGKKPHSRHARSVKHPPQRRSPSSPRRRPASGSDTESDDTASSVSSTNSEASLILQGRTRSANRDNNRGQPTSDLPDSVVATKDKRQRLAICHLYLDKLGMPARSEWDGEYGTISIIRERLYMPKGSRKTIRKVLETISAMGDNAGHYDGEQAHVGGQNKLILEDSAELEIAATAMEQGGSFTSATHDVNAYR